MANEAYKSRYTAEEMEKAFTIALSIVRNAGIPNGMGDGSMQILQLDTSQLSRYPGRIPTSEAVYKAIAAARQVSELLVFKGIVQTADDLPADAKPGFVYIVAQKDNENYAWDGVSWTPIGKLIAPIVLSSQSVSYQISDSGDTVPSGEWLIECPAVQQGKYLWTRTVVQFSVGDPITSYSCAYIGVDGREITVCGVEADESGNVDLTTTEVFVTIPASGWVGDSAPFTQTVTVAELVDGRRVMVYPVYGDDVATNLAMREACACISYTKRDGQNVTFTCLEDKPAVDIDVIAEVYV